MKFQVITTKAARDDAKEAYDWIFEQSPLAADRWLDGLLDATDSLEHFPRMYPRAYEQPVFDGELRQLLYGSHRIIYAIDGRVVRILHIRHAARQPLDEI